MKDAGIDPLLGPCEAEPMAHAYLHGLPTPNLFTGGHNYHGPYEYIVVESMEKAVEVIITLLR